MQIAMRRAGRVVGCSAHRVAYLNCTGQRINCRRFTPSVYPSDDGLYRAVVIITEGHRRHLRYVPGGARKGYDTALSIASQSAAILEKANVAFVSPRDESIPQHLRYRTE